MKGFDGLAALEGSNFKDCSTVVIIPTRGKMHEASLSPLFVRNLETLATPMNHRRMVLFSAGFTVDEAYNKQIEDILAHPVLSQFKFVLTIEDDNFPLPDAHIRLLESIERTGFDIMAGLYFTKGELNLPMAYGDAEESRKTGFLDLSTLNVLPAVEKRAVLEVNAVPMGFTLWRMDVFRKIPKPWFVTYAEFVEAENAMVRYSQDFDMCIRARTAGLRIGVDCRVKIGHFDFSSGEMH